jgi:hypothetical protein
MRILIVALGGSDVGGVCERPCKRCGERMTALAQSARC